MSSEDGRSPSSPAVTAPSTIAPVTDVSPGAWTHHFDELSERTQYVLASASLAGRLDINTATSWLSRGGIMVFTDYIRVQ